MSPVAAIVQPESMITGKSSEVKDANVQCNTIGSLKGKKMTEKQRVGRNMLRSEGVMAKEWKWGAMKAERLITWMYEPLRRTTLEGIVAPNLVNNCTRMSCLHGCRKQ